MSTLASIDINYADYFGIQSVAAAVIFGVAYLPLFGWFVFRALRQPTYVYIILSLFCAVHITAFIIRAILAGSESAGRNLGLLIGDEVLFSVGFFGLLWSAYTLVLDRQILTQNPNPTNPITCTAQNRRLFRLLLLAGVILGITSSSLFQSSTPSTASNGASLQKASTGIFLALTVVQAYLTVVLAIDERESARVGITYRYDRSFRASHAGSVVLLVISLLLMIWEVFAAATIGNARKQNNEHLWYPLVAFTEVLAVILYTAPGLVPTRAAVLGEEDSGDESEEEHAGLLRYTP